jgi:2'-5' RNA ligase
VAIPIPPAIERLRRRHDPSARAGIPAHVTLIYPFVAPSELTPAIRDRLARLVGSQPAFDVSFAAVRQFPRVVWLAPHPARAFARLTDALSDAFPEQRPYGGAFDTVIPHLTVALDDDPDVLNAVEAALTARLPIRATANLVTVAAVGSDGRWHTRWRLPLGARTTAR